MVEAEFTDRYGGHAPSWLRGCFDDCEATGHVPIEGPSNLPTEGRVIGAERISARWLPVWTESHQAAITADPMHESTCDGWHFVLCPSCHGNGTVSRWRSLARVPRWLWRGACFLVSNTRNPYMRAPWTTTRQWYWLLVKTAFLWDLGWPNRP
jgi:hypothetical protein